MSYEGHWATEFQDIVTVVGVLLRLLWLETDGTGVDSPYQGNPSICPKGHLWQIPFQQLLSAGSIFVAGDPCLISFLQRGLPLSLISTPTRCQGFKGWTQGYVASRVS